MKGAGQGGIYSAAGLGSELLQAGVLGSSVAVFENPAADTSAALEDGIANAGAASSGSFEGLSYSDSFIVIPHAVAALRRAVNESHAAAAHTNYNSASALSLFDSNQVREGDPVEGNEWVKAMSLGGAGIVTLLLVGVMLRYFMKREREEYSSDSGNQLQRLYAPIYAKNAVRAALLEASRSSQKPLEKMRGIKPYLKDPELQIRRETIDIFLQLFYDLDRKNRKECVDALLECFDDSNKYIQVAAIFAVGELIKHLEPGDRREPFNKIKAKAQLLDKDAAGAATEDADLLDIDSVRAAAETVLAASERYLPK